MEKAEEYIESLYGGKQALGRREFIEKTNWKDFIPVVDDGVARFLRVILAVKKPDRILEIGTSIGYAGGAGIRRADHHAGVRPEGGGAGAGEFCPRRRGFRD